jgi:hypothetical protein
MRYAIPTNTPGPSPWYLREGASPVSRFRWRKAGDRDPAAGKTLLDGQSGVVAILNFHNYVLPLDNDTLLVWHQRHTNTGPTEPVVMTILQPALLPPLAGRIDAALHRMKEQDLPILFEGQPQAEVRLDTDAAARTGIEFPAPLQALDELLVLCGSSYANPSPTWEHSNLALMVARPREGSIALYPQEWFNSGGLDYGYQWVTRVARDPATAYIHGDGIRISPFVLDDTLRRLRR